jgi:asparagine synthase (glutamine-hydrolysing)
MCGIAGIIGRLDEVNRAALGRMERAIAHRGPDSAAIWESAADGDGLGCILAHRRLSILDLSTAADQPMTDSRTGQTIIFNGEIYNYRELRSALQQKGENFTSTGDTEVLLRHVAVNGPRVLSEIRGMFAFALWDPKARSLLLARDPLGIKPLYICRNPDAKGNWSLLFASEVRAILASGLVPNRRLNPTAVASVIWNGFVMGPETIVQGVESLWPGEYRVFDPRSGQRSAEFFWSLPSSEQSETEESLHHVLKECVRLHLASDVPLGVFLSGGIDSSAVANLAQQSLDEPLNTFTLTFEETDYNEGAAAAQIAKAIGTHHREIPLTEERFVSNLDRAIDSLDQPTFDGLNSWYMSQAVREAGLTVALVGTGGDELFGGYKSFRDLPSLHQFNSRTRLIPQPAKMLAAQAVRAVASGRGKGAVSPQTRWAKLPDMVRAGSDMVGLYQLAYALFLPGFQGELLQKGMGNGHVQSGLPLAMRERLRSEIQNRSSLAAISVLEQRCFLAERLLRDTDAASMAVSLELRVPLVDQVLLEHVMRLPDASRYQPLGRKQILRNVGLRGLDPKLFERPKSGFVLPFDQWIRRNLGQQMDQTMRDESLARSVGLNGEAVSRLWQSFQSNAPGMYWSRAWALYILIRWAHRHNVLLS